MKSAQLMLFIVFALSLGGCTPAQNKPGAEWISFMDEKNTVPARLEWYRDFTSKKADPIRFRVMTTEGPFAVSFVTDNSWQALPVPDRKAIKKEHSLLQAFSKGSATTLEGTVDVPAGRSWIIVENRTDKPVEFHIQLFGP